jgi:hypothetical protein
MRYRRITNGEPQYGSSQQDFLQGIDAVAQSIVTSLKLYTGEWWENLSDGLPLWSKLMNYQGSNKNKNNAIITKRILGINLNGVKLISSVTNVSNSYDNVTRRYIYTGTAKSIYGKILITNGS